MKIRSLTTVSLLVASLVTQPLAGIAADRAPAEAAKPTSMHLATVMLEDMTATAAKILSKIDAKTLNAMDADRSAFAQKAINEKIDATKKSAKEVEALREEARSTAVAEAKRAKKDLTAKILGASIETLDRYAATMKTNPMYKDVVQQYAAAYTRTEKAKILTVVVQQDMDQVLSASLKRLNWLNADGLRYDLQQMKNRIFEGKGDGKKLKRLLMIAGAAVAFVGLATWGIASIKYGGIIKKQRNELETAYQARKADLDAKFAALKAELKGQRDNLAGIQKAELDALVAQLSAQYDALSIQLHDEEMAFLNGNGYVWMQCKSYTQPSSIICNNYGYQVFQGNSTCTVMCYKNVVQNKETLHAAPVCSSPYIPADCFSQAKYDAEYNAAYTSGYNNQYPIGYDDGDWDGYLAGDSDGESDGRADGDYDGYYDGYDAGDAVGYAEGYADGYPQRYTEGYEDGYDAGYAAGYDDGYDDGYSDGCWDSEFGCLASNGMANRNSSSVKANEAALLKLLAKNASEPKPQFKKGFEHGYRDAKLVLSLQSNKS